MPPSKPTVLGARCTIGVQVGSLVVNSLTLGKNCSRLELTQWGLLVQHSTKEYLVPYANIQSMELAVEPV